MEYEIKKKYKLKYDVSDKKLRDNGFKNHKFQCYIYKDIIKLIVSVDIEERWWNYLVFDENTNTIYAPYYNREYGKNLIIQELDGKIEDIFEEFVNSKIFIKKNQNRRRKCHGKTSSKV